MTLMQRQMETGRVTRTRRRERRERRSAQQPGPAGSAAIQIVWSQQQWREILELQSAIHQCCNSHHSTTHNLIP